MCIEKPLPSRDHDPIYGISADADRGQFHSERGQRGFWCFGFYDTCTLQKYEHWILHQWAELIIQDGGQNGVHFCDRAQETAQHGKKRSKTMQFFYILESETPGYVNYICICVHTCVII